MDLSHAQIKRYARHIILDEVGGAGQKRLLASRVAVVSAGTCIGFDAAIYLVACGVGTVGLYGVGDGASASLRKLNPDVFCEQSADDPVGRLREQNGEGDGTEPAAYLQFVGPDDGSSDEGPRWGTFDVVIDAGAPSWPRAPDHPSGADCSRPPLVHCGQSQGGPHVTVLRSTDAHCGTCREGVPPLAPSEVLSLMLGTVAATETIKILLGIGEPLYDRMLRFTPEGLPTA